VAIEIVGCRDKGGRRVMKQNDDVGTPLVVIDDDDRTTCSSRAESVERLCLKEVLKTWQRSNMNNETVALV